jgi:hypothetical protein
MELQDGEERKWMEMKVQVRLSVYSYISLSDDECIIGQSRLTGNSVAVVTE